LFAYQKYFDFTASFRFLIPSPMDVDKLTHTEDVSYLTPKQDSISVSSENGGVEENVPLKRELKSRHIIMISVGGVIGQGLFLSSGGALAAAGPAGLLIAYFIIGFIVFWVTFALG
jgi:lysine-specific permease